MGRKRVHPTSKRPKAADVPLPTETERFVNMVTPFTRRVYNVVLTIPLGQTRTYQWVAAQAGKPRAARAVGQVLRKNPYPLLIPCHRVVGAGGELVGYSGTGGLKRKQELLDLERKIRRNML